MFPPPILRSGVLRQGSDKFYSVSFQARHSFFATVESFWLAWKLSSSRISLFPLDRASPLHWLFRWGNTEKYQSALFREKDSHQHPTCESFYQKCYFCVACCNRQNQGKAVHEKHRIRDRKNLFLQWQKLCLGEAVRRSHPYNRLLAKSCLHKQRVCVLILFRQLDICEDAPPLPVTRHV